MLYKRRVDIRRTCMAKLAPNTSARCSEATPASLASHRETRPKQFAGVARVHVAAGP